MVARPLSRIGAPDQNPKSRKTLEAAGGIEPPYGALQAPA
jgi:hypothetical protein